MKLKTSTFSKLVSLIFVITLFANLNISAQAVRIGAGSGTPDASAILDIVSTTSGILIPRMTEAQRTNAAFDLTGSPEGVLVYQTDGAVPGFYFYNGTDWQNLFSGTVPTVPGESEYWLRPDADPTYIYPEGNTMVKIYDSGETYGVFYDGGQNQYGLYGRTTNVVDPTSAVVGFSDVSGNQTYGFLGYNGTYNSGTGFGSLDGMAVYGMVDDPDRAAGFFRTTDNASVASLISYSDVWTAGYFYIDNDDNTYSARTALYGQSVVDCDQSGFQTAIKGHSSFTHNTNSGYTVGGAFIGVGNSQDAIGVYGHASTSGSGNFVTVGGYFYAENSYYGDNAYAYVADEWSLRKITGTNAVSEIIPTEKHGRITMTCPEAPEYLYYDYGTVELVNGKAHVDIDPILADIIVVDKKNPIKVFLQVNIPVCEGVAVINKTATGFDLVERNNGNSSGEIDYQIVVKPKTLFGEGRFVQAPGPAYITRDNEPKSAKALNQRNKSEIFTWPPDWKVYNYNPEDYVEIGEIIPAGPNAGKIKGKNGTFLNSVKKIKNNISQQKKSISPKKIDK